jgi:hypothetical protein
MASSVGDGKGFARCSVETPQRAKLRSRTGLHHSARSTQLA